MIRKEFAVVSALALPFNGVTMLKPKYNSLMSGSLLVAGALWCASGALAADAPSARTSPVNPPPIPGTTLETMVERGATMQEIHNMRPTIASTPDEAIYQMKVGSARFFGGKATRPELSANERRAQVISQSPFVGVIGCSDSRVPIEIVFDQGLGSVFVSRVAGNVVDPGTAGSMEYAVVALETPLLVVLGHEGCGAVKAAMSPASDQAKLPANVRYLLDKISPSLKDMPKIRDEQAKMREAVIANVRLQTYRLGQNPTVAAAVKANKTKVIGAYYQISSGAVDFLETPEELKLTPEEMRRAQLEVRQLLAATPPAHDHAHAHAAH